MGILTFQKANCKNCYKCVRQCPVKAIEVRDHQAQILEESCILCGGCMLACPQNAKVVRSDVERVRAFIDEGRRVIASVAPSFVAAFGVSFPDMARALQTLGFSKVRETAEGAYLVKTRYEELVAARWNSVILSSCCSTVVRLIQEHYPEALRCLAPVLSPMQAHARLLRRQSPDSTVVFIGPCVSKKDECERFPDSPELALTFDELTVWMRDCGVMLTPSGEADVPFYSRFFPVSGGILNTMRKDCDYHYLAVDGLENCMAVLDELRDGGLENCFVELSACAGSCVGGPGWMRERPSLLRARCRVERAAGQGRDYDLPVGELLEKKIAPHPVCGPMPTDEEIKRVLRRMGKHSPQDELNCGTCGYATCREKAAAVCLGKAEISMCLPFMKERAESISFQVIDNVPCGIVTVDRELTVQQINPTACRIFGVLDGASLIGAPVSQLMDEYGFVQAVVAEGSLVSRREHRENPERYLEEDFRYDGSSGMVLCVIKDITQEEQARNQKVKTQLAAAEITDKILEKQLRIVHEIASLLGETAAETQVALTDLKDAILTEGCKQ